MKCIREHKMLEQLYKICHETGQFQIKLENRTVCNTFNLNNTPRCEYLSELPVGTCEKQKNLTQKPVIKYICLMDYKNKQSDNKH